MLLPIAPAAYSETTVEAYICNGSGFLFQSVLGAHGKAEAGLAIGGDAGYHEPFARKLPPSRYAAW